MASRCRAPAGAGRGRCRGIVARPANRFRSDRDRPSRQTDHAAMMSNSRRATPLSSASSPGRLSRPLVSLIPSSRIWGLLSAPTASASVLLVQPVENCRTGKSSATRCELNLGSARRRHACGSAGPRVWELSSYFRFSNVRLQVSRASPESGIRAVHHQSAPNAAEVADMRRTSLTLAADTFSSLAVSRTPRPSSNASTNALHLERRRPRPAQALAG